MTEEYHFPELAPLTEEAYRVLGNYTPRIPLHVCSCEMCMPHDYQREKFSVPVRDLDIGLLQAWEESAASSEKVARDQGQPVTEAWMNEVKTFLPRIFETIACGHSPSNLGIENAFRTVALANWPSWPETERATLLRFAETYFLARLSLVEVSFAPIGHVLSLDTDGADVAVALIILGLKPERVITLWEKAPDPMAAVHLAEARRSLEYDYDEMGYLFRSVWLDDKTALASLGDFLSSPEADKRLEAAFFSLEGDDHDTKAQREILSRAIG
ncbi:MAG: hypothetical protein AAGE89_00805 [Pseudomonadota bacterium]